MGVPQTFDEHIKLQFDLLALPFQADITRIGTLLSPATSRPCTYPESEAHGGIPRRVDSARIRGDRRAFEDQPVPHQDGGAPGREAATTRDGNGTLLDQSLVLYGSNMGNPNQHLHHDVPHVLIGGLNGKLQGGRHLAYPTKTVPTGNLLLSILDKFGIHQDSIGDSTGRLDNL